ncbi:PREDICTED: splicing factor 3A subunit 3 [Atta cephalotes]|uniref:Matrin-type domain-containing protein n=2 Tax=Atta TaxID=12956 RepID=A0A158NFY6_ATTCE|nr:PREDICTED: splicing factor 3A subunit 3 [Atta cephalotes]XP_018053964.1 PREDICTED: splicing factor 3A subunit 3 [Atta colombica]KYM78567.1 Splicing factor 3A subunit 3 [Atta colombica]
METILEQQRRYHEERERLMDAMVKEMLHKKAGHRENINSEHRLKMLLDQFMDSTMHLQDLYEDKDGQRKEEVQALSGPNEFSEFYSRLKSIKEFYRRHPNEISVPMSVEFEELAKMRENPTEELSNLVEFTDEEGYGKYLDLHECYQKYINLKGIEKIDYITYLSTFDHLFDIPRERKNAEYQRYVETLLGYLTDYLNRVRPLLDISTEIEEANKDFQIQWEKNTFPGWPKETGSALAHVGAHLELSAFSSWEELASLGLDRLKSALMALGLKCGGTLEERAQRLFSTKGEASLDPNLLAKNRKGKSAKGKDSEKQKEIARFEAHVYKLAELVSSQRVATKENVQRKQARTEGERGDSDAEASASESEEEDDNEVPYNPKNLPLGWDGKPIPYWLYKLHGLNISYNCEICGNFTYKGPKAFQRHFAEWRHAHGMRCLGIPNTAHFANVTQIEDALALWEKLKAQKQAERWQPEQEEEFEDSLGNVVNRKTYEDLKRQGLL